ncbi:hypothetical protein CC78DRAFT_538170 [Lojkania enalia]|uniref:Uncharacterized protein n=1 Tax=Lojkania enalia TaxID=147567 RepID=A0A9P4N0R0_9PLEO|nr:hypothetical protein CC78DRAFT_538170 [Didymosphaeria enalia]
MCHTIVSRTAYYGCGDIVEEENTTTCPEKDKPDHKPTKEWVGSGSNTGKCGKADCKNP